MGFEECAALYNVAGMVGALPGSSGQAADEFIGLDECVAGQDADLVFDREQADMVWKPCDGRWYPSKIVLPDMSFVCVVHSRVFVIVVHEAGRDNKYPFRSLDARSKPISSPVDNEFFRRRRSPDLQFMRTNPPRSELRRCYRPPTVARI